jgi:hypothetical protein
MPQNFKVRLGDGTELAVDTVGLRTWAIDEHAVVQTKNGWKPLKDVLAFVDRPPQPDDGIAIIPFKKIDKEPMRPPPATSELATLRFAAGSDDDDVVEDDEMYDGGPGVVGTAWMWTQRLVLVAVLGVGGYFAATTWQVWLPKAGQFGVNVLAQIQKYTGGAPPSAAPVAGDQSQEVRAAVQAAATELPHLSPEAIQLVMTSSLTGLLDPPEVFRRAHDAAERGSSALAADEAEELRALKATLFDTLTPVERERIKEYEQARGFRATLPFEDRAALGSWAHGARSLPSRSQDRLRSLLGKAIRSGLRAKKPASSASSVVARAGEQQQ